MEKQFLLKKEDIKSLIKLGFSCIVSDRITVDEKKIGYMYRENPTSEFDTGWRFFAGDEDEQYIDNPNNFEIYELNTICNYDQDVIPYLMKPAGTKLERSDKEFKEVND
ncbi:MAG: DUF2185 domain-containing protein [Mollicutes bacterium]|nr:DUF2185 domain-containing protein [Mollicutes bacterium]